MGNEREIAHNLVCIEKLKSNDQKAKIGGRILFETEPQPPPHLSIFSADREAQLHGLYRGVNK